MRAVVQRVTRASVAVNDQVISEIGRGFLVLLGVEVGDTDVDLSYMVDKVANLRVFEDGQGKMNLSLLDTGGQLLVVSQFTLLGDARHGRRPGFTLAEEPGKADRMYMEAAEALARPGYSGGNGRLPRGYGREPSKRRPGDHPVGFQKNVLGDRMNIHVETIPVGSEFTTNCYLAENSDTKELVILDPGADAEKIIAAIGERKPVAVLITHGHFDHIAAADAVCDQYHIPLYIHELDAAKLTDEKMNESTGFGSVAVTVNTKPVDAGWRTGAFACRDGNYRAAYARAFQGQRLLFSAGSSGRVLRGYAV